MTDSQFNGFVGFVLDDIKEVLENMANAPVPIFLRIFDRIVTVFSFLQPLNAPFPISFTFFR